MTRIYYRADKRRFEVGCNIGTAREFGLLQDKSARCVEQLLANRKPAMKPNRYDCLMLFEDRICAKEYWAKLTGGRLYAVGISKSPILHRGDMHIIDKMDAMLRNGGKICELDRLADAYWRGDESPHPCIEILVCSATVIAQLGTEEERVAWLNKRYKASSNGSEPEEHPAADIFAGPQRHAC